MSMKDLNKKLEEIFKRQNCESVIIEKLDEIYDEFSVRQVNAWRNLSNRTKNTLLHELVEKDYLDVVRHVISKYKLRTFFKRESDGLTPLELAQLNRNSQMSDLLIQFRDDQALTETSEQFSRKKTNDQILNIVWMDLEFTSFENPQILECAVIITDKDLHEIQRKTWVVHFDQEIIDGLGEWHQNAFKDISHGGNGLFKEVLSSTITKQQMEDELLDLLKVHCPEKACPLAGSSIHVDKQVMKVEMPTVHNYLHYRVIDVTSFQEIIKRWAPQTGSKFTRKIASDGRQTVTHRAMDDIEWSLEMMKLFKPLITSQKFTKETRKGSSTKDQNQSSSQMSNVQQSQSPSILSSIDRSKLENDEKQVIQRIEFDQTFDVEKLQLNDDQQKIYHQNPHLRQVFANHQPLIHYDQQFNNENRQLGQSSLNKFSIPINNSLQINTTEYWPQRTLILSHIEFLTQFSTDKTCLVIYVGDGSGMHFNYLSSLFPHLHFILFIQKDFINIENKQIEIKSQNFNDQLATKYIQKQNETLLFICDMKTFTNQENIEKDIDDQIRWQQIIKPHYSLFTFRLPKTKQTFKYFNGQFLWDLWSSKEYIQWKVIVQKDTNIKEYLQKDLQREFNSFHNLTRTMFYNHQLDHIQTEGLDHCYDCTAEIFILQQYLIEIKQIKQEKQLQQAIAQLSHQISTNIYQIYQQTIRNIPRALNINQNN